MVSFLPDFITGKSATKAAQAQLEALSRAESTLNDNRGTLQDLFGRGAQTGDQSLLSLAQFLGLNGPQAQQGQFDTALNNPARAGLRDDITQQVERSAVGRGQLNSGASQNALQSRLLDLDNRFLDNRFNSLAQLAQLGGNARNNLASGLIGNTNSLANLQARSGDVRGTGIINKSNIQGQAFQSGLSLLGSIGGAALGGGFGGFGGLGGGGGASTFSNNRLNAQAFRGV